MQFNPKWADERSQVTSSRKRTKKKKCVTAQQIKWIQPLKCFFCVFFVIRRVSEQRLLLISINNSQHWFGLPCFGIRFLDCIPKWNWPIQKNIDSFTLHLWDYPQWQSEHQHPIYLKNENDAISKEHNEKNVKANDEWKEKVKIIKRNKYKR